jgi:hypothetical protein
MKKIPKAEAKISSTQRLEALLSESEQELEALEPQIEKLEKQVEKLKELKLAKQKLITLKLSIKSILSNFSSSSKNETSTQIIEKEFRHLLSTKTSQKEFSTSHFSPIPNNEVLTRYATVPMAKSNGTFLPESAFQEVDMVLKRKNSINYELFRAIVFKGGKASTEAIKHYLVEHRIKQPGNGESFDTVELTDISSRINYLVRKGVVEPDGRGNFVSRLGWLEENSDVSAMH